MGRRPNRWCMRHMGANLYDHFKNRDMMVLFKRLCTQNQQRKFNALWKLLDDMTVKHIEYIDKKRTQDQQHKVEPTGTRQQRFEVACKDICRRGVRRERVGQECLLREDGMAACTCHKPKMLHLPCSHVIAACVESGVQPRSFVSPYFTKEAVAST